jgi:acid stress-induced BolA-like protein IbaG/YrbA
MELKDIKSNLRQYLRLKDEIGVLSTRQNELKSRLTEAVDEIEADDRGHRVLVVEDELAGEVKLTRQRRVSKTLDMEVAEDILTKKGIKDTCIKMVPQIDEDAIMTAFYGGYLTEEDIDKMFPAKVSYAFLVDAK